MNVVPLLCRGHVIGNAVIESEGNGYRATFSVYPGFEIIEDFWRRYPERFYTSAEIHPDHYEILKISLVYMGQKEQSHE